MIGLLLALASIPVLVGGALYLLHAGLRSGDRAQDVAVSAHLGTITQPDGRLPVIVVTVRNPSAVPVLVGLSAHPRRLPRWLDPGMSVAVPARTTRRRFRPERQAVVGVAGAGAVARWQVAPPPGRRRCRLVAVVGQSETRLRVVGVPLGPVPPPAPAGRPQRTDARR